MLRPVLLVLAVLASVASADTQVGTTKDACDKSETVTFIGKGGAKIPVKANQTGQSDLDKPVRELTWFCGKSQEASSNDTPYDHVKLARKPNGAMTWTFIRISAPASPPAGSPVIAAYTKALDSLVLGPETVDSGAYAKAVEAAKAQLAKDLAAAMRKHAEDTKLDLAAVRKSADPQLGAYLDAVSARYAKTPAPELPKAFWPTTIALP